jgi:hypothetical protein
MLLRRKLTVLLMTVMLLVVSATPALAPATSRTGHSPPSRLDMLTGSNRHRPRSPRLAEATESSTATHRTGTNLKSASTADFSVVDPRSHDAYIRSGRRVYSTTPTCMAHVGQYQRNTL